MIEQQVLEDTAVPDPEPLGPTTPVRRIWAHFAKDVRKRRRSLLAGSLFGVLYAAARVAEPWPIKVVFDQVLYHKPARGWWVPLFTVFGSSPTDLLAAAGALLGVAGVVRGLSYYYEDYLLSSAAQQIVYAIRSRLYRHLHALPLSFHQSRRTGDTLVRLSSDIILLRDVVVDGLVNLGTGAVMLLMMVIVMALVDPLLTLVAMVVMPLIMVLTAFYGRRIRANSKKQRKREGEVAAAMHEALSAMAVVQVHGAGGREQERFHDINRRSLKQGIKATRLEAAMNRSVEMTVAAGLAVIMTLGTVRAMHGVITPGDLIVFVSYLRAAYRPLQRASKTVQRGAKALAAAERVVEILETEAVLTDAPDAREAPRFAGRVEFDRVRFGYAPDRPVLEDVSVIAEPGTKLAIVGHTGSGKSTMLALMPRLFDVGEGRVTIDGHDVRELTLESLRSQISIVLQDSVLFGLTVAENIRYGAPDATDQQVTQAAVAAGIHDVITALPDGYDTVISERGASLSGGQRQRVAIARALVRDTPILLLDEPTTGLDAGTQREVIGALEPLMRDRTTILVTHDMRLVEDADQVLVLDAGRVVAQGTPSELMSRSIAYRRLAAPAPDVRPAARPAGHAPRALFYSHNGVGVGHVQRQIDLATAFKRRHPDSPVLLVTGSPAAAMFALPDGIDSLKLPSLSMVDRYRTWRPRDLAVPTETVTAMRSELLLQAVRGFQPDLLVADFMPAGPYGELLPALDALERQGGAAVAGFRDVVDEPAFVRTLWSETGVYEVLRRHYAAICVYGDPQMIDFIGDYGLDPELAARTTYTGYLGRARPPGPPAGLPSGPVILATSGGGVDGMDMLEAFIEASATLRSSIDAAWVAVTGPLMPDDAHARVERSARAAGVTVHRAVPQLRAWIAAADCVIAMAGYNTVCDILSFERPAALVPRRGPSQEQLIRSARFAEAGLAEVASPSELHGGTLARAIHRALNRPRPQCQLELDGVARTMAVLDQITAHAAAA